jgi:hypothetical protein
VATIYPLRIILEDYFQYPHVVITEPDLTKCYWCIKNSNSEWNMAKKGFSFADPADAMLFKLTCI